MRDKIHQPYRAPLIPGLSQILSSLSPSTHKGLCGICLSGAGPTILALATENFEGIATTILEFFAKEGVTAEWMVLEPAEDGATTTEVKGSLGSLGFENNSVGVHQSAGLNATATKAARSA